MTANGIVNADMILAEEKRKVRLLKEIGRAQRTILTDVKGKVLILQQLCIGFQLVLGNTKHFIDTVRPNESTPPFVRNNNNKW